MVFFIRIALFVMLSFLFNINVYSFKYVESEIINLALEKKIYLNPKWRALLHLDKQTLKINDDKFILSNKNFSPRNELIRTISLFFNQDNDNACNFPARFEFITHELGLDKALFPKRNCTEFNEYLEKAPAEEIKLVFVSEDVSNPSSMMGHTFFKIISGKREHAVSFFTVIDTYNIPALIFKSTIKGMRGFFSLTPYREQLYRYLKVENRNVWEFDLNLNDYEKKLIYYHFWELRTLNIKYLFTGFNCATIVHDILSIAQPKLRKINRLWVTPKDVIKDAYEYNLVTSIKLVPSEKWYIKMLEENSNPYCKDYVFKFFSDTNVINDKFVKKIKEDCGEIDKELLRSYFDYLRRKGKNNITLTKLNSIINENAQEKYILDLTKYKSPLFTSDDSQIEVGLVEKNSNSYLRLSILPASNKLTDDNRQYFSESTLKIAEINLLLNNKSLRLDSFHLYQMKSLIPYSKFTKDISGSFDLSIIDYYDNKLNSHKMLNVSGGVGAALKLSPDVIVYLLGNISVGVNDKTISGFLAPELGVIVYEIFNMKSVLQIIPHYGLYNGEVSYNLFKFSQSIFATSNYNFSFDLEYRDSTNDFDKKLTFSIVKYF
jgi:hypothetical protein